MSEPEADNLAEIRELGRKARIADVSYFSIPYFNALTLERLVSAGGAWAAGWLEEDPGRTESVLQHLRAEVPRLCL
jgi:hypothetical protein